MQAKTLMKKFLIEKWLWEEFIRYYTEVKLEWLVVKKEKLPTIVYTPRMTRTQRKERAKRIIEMRNEWMTLREIWDKENISYETVRYIILAYK
jgi:hypothetical protein